MHPDEERLTLSNRIHMVLGGTEIRGILRYFYESWTTVGASTSDATVREDHARVIER